MLSFTNLALRRGPNLLFEDVSFVIHRDKKVGLIGANGAGKTSLFKMITGELDVEDGYLDYPQDLRISYLAQEVVGTDQRAVEYVLEGDKQLIQIQQQIKSAEANEQFDKLGELHEIFNSLDGHSALSKAEQLMVGLGFTQDDLDKTVKDFSGGWRVRLNLARTLMQPSDLLLLDEPTNHLDLDAIVWLSDWIKSFKGALLLISHDREFLDECVNTIAHISKQSIELYTGNYSQFEEVKALRLAEVAASYKKQQRQIEHMQDFVRRFKAKATKAKQAQSRVKALERMEVIAPAHVDSPFHFSIPQSEKISDPLLTLDRANLGYSEKVLSSVNISLHPGDRIGLLGPNGAGKTTTVEILEGYRVANSGQVRVLGFDPATKGATAQKWRNQIGIVLQATNDAADLSVIETISHFANYYENPRDVKQVIEEVGLEEKVGAKVRQLSGGQRRRLDVALGIIGSPELLFLDEPTTGFDPEARRSFWELIRTLKSEGTTILLTTHYLDEAQALADRVGVINEGVIIEIATPDTLGGRNNAPAKVTWLENGVTQELLTKNPTEEVLKLSQRFNNQIPELQVLRPNLEEIYLRMIGELK